MTDFPPTSSLRALSSVSEHARQIADRPLSYDAKAGDVLSLVRRWWSSVLMRNSLTHRALVFYLCASLVLTLLVTVAAYVLVRHEQAQRVRTYLLSQAQLHAGVAGELRDDLEKIHHLASLSFQQKLKELRHVPDAQVQQRFSAYFPEFGDGTRRSIPQLFDGYYHGGELQKYGLGVYIGEGRHITIEDQRISLAALEVIYQTGSSVQQLVDNFSFFTKNRTAIIFSPNGEDRLKFFRQEIGPDFDFKIDEFYKLVLPQNNPSRQTNCTNLQFRYNDKTQNRGFVACVTPIDLEGVFLGGFSNTVDAGNNLRHDFDNLPPGAMALILDRRGDVVAFPGFDSGIEPSQALKDRRKQLQDQYQTHELMVRISKDPEVAGIKKSFSGDWVGFSNISGAPWTYIVLMPSSILFSQSLDVVLWISIISLCVAVFLSVLTSFVGFILSSDRLMRLRDAACSHDEAVLQELRAISVRSDEIGAVSGAVLEERLNYEVLNQKYQNICSELSNIQDQFHAMKIDIVDNLSKIMLGPISQLRESYDSINYGKSIELSPEYMKRTESYIIQCYKALDQLVEYTRLDLGAIYMDSNEFNLEDLVSESLMAVGKYLEQNGFEFRSIHFDGIDQAYVGDALRLRKILTGLGQGLLEAGGAGLVDLWVSQHADGVEFHFACFGRGFNARLAQILTEVPGSANNTQLRRIFPGGLSLPLAWRLCHHLGGKISASVLDDGLSFIVVLPLRPVQAADPAGPLTASLRS